MKTLKILGVLGGMLVVFISFSSANAQYYYYGRTPTLAVNQQGSGDNVQVTVSNADPNSQITLHRRQTTQLWTVITNFGQTDANGYYSSWQSLGSDGSNNVVEQYVVVNGRQSNTIQTYPYSGGCNYNCGYPGTISLSQNNLSLNVNQSATVNVYGTGSYYISSNSNSAIATASLSGSQINVYGYSNGSTNISICASNYSSACATLYVTVTGSGQTGILTLSPQNPQLSIGQSMNVSINAPYFYSGSYYVSGNSNSNVVTASISGNTVYLYGQNNGSSTITICQSSSPNSCATLYVTVMGSATGSMTLSPQNPQLNAGQNLTVSIGVPYLYSGNFYISSNSNSNVVTANISGSSVNLYAQNSGTSTITVCQSSSPNACATMYVTVSGGGSGSVWLSPSSLNMQTNQTTNVNIYSNNYSGSYYISNNSSAYVATASISGSNLSVTAYNQGTTNMTICQSNSGACANLSVTVNQYNNNSLTFSQNNVNLNYGQSISLTVYGSGSYYIASNSNSNAVTASVSGNSIYLYGQNNGSSTISVCQSYNNQCGYLYVTVGGGSGGNILSFQGSSLPQARVGQFYSVQLSAMGGQAPYTYQIQTGQLPQGLSLYSNGMILGTPQNSVANTFTVRVQDNYGRSATQNFTISFGSTLGAGGFYSGSLIRENGTVYMVYRGMKSGFSSLTVFRAFGFNLNNVVYAKILGLPDTGFIISNSRTSHPWGTWVKSGQTVYFVHESGLVPVPSWDVFLNNGGQSHMIVSANSYDLNLPILPIMVSGDARVN